MGLIGSFYIMTTFLGFGAATLVGKAHICASIVNGKCVGKPNSNLAAPRLAEFLGGQFFAPPAPSSCSRSSQRSPLRRSWRWWPG